MTTITTELRGERRPQSPLGASAGSAALAVARRSGRKFVRTPQLIVVGAIQPVMFLLIFRYVFGGAINAGGVPYVDFFVRRRTSSNGPRNEHHRDRAASCSVRRSDG